MPEQCYLCEAEATTRDHIPPRSYFEKVPVNIITVPACEKCNASLRKDEEYYRAALTMECYERSDVARRMWDGRVVPSLWRKGFDGFRKRLLNQTGLVRLPTGVLRTLVVGEGQRVATVIRKIIRGLHFQLQGSRIAAEDVLIFRDIDCPRQLGRITRHWSELDMGEEFRCRYQFTGSDGAIWIEFYRAVWWLALVGEPAREYPNRARRFQSPHQAGNR